MTSSVESTAAAVTPAEGLRESLYRILGGLFEAPPSAELLESLEREEVFRQLAEDSEFLFGRALEGLGALEAGARLEYSDVITQEFARLFVGPETLPAPPWESVYRSPDRLVMQQPAYEVLEAYVATGLGYDQMTKCPPDHVAKELGFMAALIAGPRELNLDPALSHATQREFLDRHLSTWLPDFAEDLRRAASTPFYRGAAELLRDFVALDTRTFTP
ncbi:MAG: molecular chaperone TorD family protein [Deltaproteobacteria bacterium]|nr:molecular chaperone TorD family protein [Deltaproteobacteria bacterium]